MSFYHLSCILRSSITHSRDCFLSRDDLPVREVFVRQHVLDSTRVHAMPSDHRILYPSSCPALKLLISSVLLPFIHLRHLLTQVVLTFNAY
jgi:hypothetical protein